MIARAAIGVVIIPVSTLINKNIQFLANKNYRSAR